MSEHTTHRPSASQIRGYKRSWKNLLINKQYQLRFTLVMAGLAGVLIAALGYYVMVYADRTTTIGINRVISEPCPEVPAIVVPPTAPAPPAGLEPGSAADAGSGDDAGKAKVVHIQIDSEMTDAAGNPIDVAPAPPPLPPPPPALAGDFVDQSLAHWGCEYRHAGAVENLHRGRFHILLVLVGAGIVLVLGLAIYGIKMTHKVAGPLYKVTLYLAKMRDGRYDKVWNLRKGDQLVSFYEHFKSAHAGVVAMEQADIARLRELVAAIEQEPQAWSAPELAPHVAALREMLARKEKSIV